MRKRIISSLSLLLAGAGAASALAQPPAPLPPPPPGTIVTTTVGEPRRSPYWPLPYGVEPFGADNCANGACGAKGPGACNTPSEPVNECWWGNVEYLLFWVKDGPINGPLITTSSPGALGVLGVGDTAPVGKTAFDYKAASGGRFTIGGWLDKCDHSLGIEGSGFLLEGRTDSFSGTSAVTGTPLLARPFINPITGAQSAFLVSAPGQFQGVVNVGSTSQLYGWEANFVIPSSYSDPAFKFEWLAGVRYLNLQEDLSVLQTTNLLAGGTGGFSGRVVIPPGQYVIGDIFQNRNEFWGGQVGARGSYRSGKLFVDGRAKLALGATHEVASVDGATKLTGTLPPAGAVAPLPGGPVVGGVLALSSNMGRTARDEFSIVPEFGFNVGYEVCPMFKFYAGYTLLYWSHVARPGEQVDRVINPTIVPSSQAFGVATGPARPQFTFDSSDFWAQGVNFGFEVRY